MIDVASTGPCHSRIAGMAKPVVLPDWVGPITITDRSLAAMAISAVVLVIVGYALLRTRIGRATRAVSDNPALAQASGIDTDKVIRLVWTVAERWQM